MYKKSILILLVVSLVVVFSGTAAANTINQYQREVTISEGESFVEDTLLFDEMPENLRVPLMFDIDNFETRANFANYQCVVDDATYGSLITCELDEGETGRLTLEFTTNQLVENIDDFYHFSDNLRTPLDTDSLVYNLRLDSDYVLIEEDTDIPFRPFSPRDGSKTSDGRRIIVYWSREAPDTDSISPSVTYESVDTTVETDNTTFYILLFGTLLLLALLVMIIFSKGDTKEETQEKVYTALKDDERIVMDIVEGNDGEIKQKRIVETVEFSKAKVSRLIRDLKERGLLDTKRVGRTNRVFIPDDDQEE